MLVIWAKTLFDLLFPKSIRGWILLVIGTMSVMGLIVHGSGYSFDPIIHIATKYYDEVLEGTLGLAKPWLEGLIRLIGKYLEVNINLHSDWKYVFVLMMMYFLKDAEGAKSFQRYEAAVVHIIFGFVVTLICSLSIGIVSEEDALWNHFLIASIPVIGLLTYAFIGLLYVTIREPKIAVTGWSYFRKGVLLAFIRTIIFLVIIWGCLIFPSILMLNKPGIFVLNIVIVFFGIYWMLEGIRETNKLRREQKIYIEPWPLTYKNSGCVKVGTMMLRTFFFFGASLAILTAGRLFMALVVGGL